MSGDRFDVLDATIDGLISRGKTLRANREALAAQLLTPQGSKAFELQLQTLRAASARFDLCSRELGKTADVMAALRRKKRCGVRA